MYESRYMTGAGTSGERHSQLFGFPVSRPTLEPPQLADLTLTRLIGRGSYGEVWLGRTVTGAARAVKIVRRNSFSDSRPFEREFEGVKRSETVSREHPGLADVLHVGQSGSGDFFY